MPTSIYKNEGLKVMLVTDYHSLDDVLEGMENAIKGCGFFPKGHLEFVEDEFVEVEND